MDDGWKRVWAEMADEELEDRLLTYLWLSLHTLDEHAGRIAQLIQEAGGVGNRKWWGAP